MKAKNKISIVVASDNFFAIMIAALLKSIDVNHATDEHIDFYIIDDGISAVNRKRLETIADPKRITLRWFKSKDIVPKDIHIPMDKSSFPVTVFLRIFIPYMIDQETDKVIYIDVDTIVQDDISRLWNIDLGDYTIGAVQDYAKTVDCRWAGIPNYKQLGLAGDTKYFNSGVLLINPKKWRQQDITNEVISVLGKYREHVVMPDQYGLNVVFANKWKELDPKWNWFVNQENDHPWLIHFVEIKPIFVSYKFDQYYRQQFFKYLAMTPWRNFKPISDNRRLLKKIVTRIKKKLLKF
jgi:lipopolysaccharide biosynthesis glycosyltransferase